MDYLKTHFPVVNTLPDHLRLFTLLTEEEIINSTKLFPYTIVVCDKSEPANRCSSGPCVLPFSDLLDFARRIRLRYGHLVALESLKIRPWWYFHRIVGDAILRYFFEKGVLFRALNKSDIPNFVVQILGAPLFPILKPVASVSRTASVNKRKKLKTRKENDTEVEQNQTSARQIALDLGNETKRKKHRRGKRKKCKTVNNGALSHARTLLAVPPGNKSAGSRDTKQVAAAMLLVPIKRILYCGDMRERFIGKHPIANAAKTKCELDKAFFQKTFGSIESHPGYFEASVSITQLCSLFCQWVKSHKRCAIYSSYLYIFCPIDATESQADDTERLPTLVQSSCQMVGVKRALEAIFFRLVPSGLFGEANTARLLSAVLQYVVTARRYDATSLHQLATCVKSSECVWLRQIRNSSLRQHLMLRVLNLLVRYLFRVVSSCFYITDSQSDKYRLFFYRKQVWHQIMRLASEQFRQRCQLVPFYKHPTSLYFGPFALRWIPKSANDVRPIICGQFGQRRTIASKPVTNSVTAMNIELRPILAIAQYLVRKNKSLVFGRATKDFSDIHFQWKNYVSKQRQCKTSSRYYVVKADVSGCFDSIDQKLLWRIVEEKLLANAPEQFSLQGHWIFRSLANGLNRKYRFSVYPSGMFESLARYYTQLSEYANSEASNKPAHRRNSLVVPKGDPIIISKASFAECIERLIFRRVLAISGKRCRYLQTVGISQGSSLSVLLCDLYLADLEEKYLNPLIGEDDLMMRHIDDLIYITPSPERAERFAQLISNGFPAFNCYFKVDKTIANFQWNIAISEDITLFAPNINNVKTMIPWCGLLFDASSFDVFIDYHRWRGKDPRDFIVVDFSKYPPSYVVQKLLFYLRTRFSNIPLDRSTNSAACVRRNVKILIKSLADFYSAYVRAYEANTLIDNKAKNRLRQQEFVGELGRRVFAAVCGRLKVSDKGNALLRLRNVRKMFLTQAENASAI